MSEYDSIDLLNYAMYGNDIDPEWEDIRNFIKSNSAAQKELEELKRNLPSSGKRRRDFIPEREAYSRPADPNLPQSPPGQETSGGKKSWWQKVLGD